MYATAYRTPEGFSSVGFIGNFAARGNRIRVADPIFGWRVVDADDCFCTIFTETGYVLPGVMPILSNTLVSDWLMPEAEIERLAEHGRLAANKKIESIWLEPELGGDKFPSGYPLAWKRIQRWRYETAPDWRSLALSAIFARISIKRPIEYAERIYRMFGPTLRDWLVSGRVPSRAQMKRWRGVAGTRAAAAKPGKGYDDIGSILSIIDWAPWAAEVLKNTDDVSRQVRDIIAREYVPWNVGLAKLSFTLMLAGRDAACLDTRMLGYFFGEPGAEDFEIPEEESFEDFENSGEGSFVGNARGEPPENRLVFEQRIAKRDGKGLTRAAVRWYRWAEDKLEETPYFDPDWPQPFAKAQWLLWETLGRTAGTASHSALWHVIDPLIEQITTGKLEPIPEHMQVNSHAEESDIERAAQLLLYMPHDKAYETLVDDGMDPDTAHHALRAGQVELDSRFKESTEAHGRLRRDAPWLFEDHKP